ncbi:MAG: integrase arm-type DNA-binding domain-containing protein [Alphaproteobacteria bacterium]|nr:integrase arm-type DNA-binding domain-containing protein [Alphaproteobacteria bacterium]
MGKLADTAIRGELAPGKYGDGEGLWLLVSPKGAKRWVFRWKFDSRENSMALGPYPSLPLAKARIEATRCCAAIAEGKDPAQLRRAERQQRRDEEARAITFKEGVAAYMAMRPEHWKSEARKTEWLDLLERYAYPVLGADAIVALDKHRVLKVLQQEVPPLLAPSDGRVLMPGGPLWTSRPETAAKVRLRIEQVLDWAHAAEIRSGENPARWRGNLKELLGKNLARRRRKHYRALPYKDIPSFVDELHERRNLVTALALEFLILTTTRTSETLGARPNEMDEENAVWIIPPERMKAEREHRVPLCARALEILREVRALHGNSVYVFPGRKRNQPLSNAALLALVQRMGREVTVHGCRSTFRDWVAEATSFDRDLAEIQIAHKVADDTEEAYWRSLMLEKRRAMMNAWAAFCEGHIGDNVVQIGVRAA